jgi:glycerol-3-phosphate dehydrogenase (NAD(P)+)
VDKFTVIGSGSWATAIVKILCNNVEKVNWFVRTPESAEYIKKYKHNPRYLQSVEFNLDKINVITDLEEAINSSEILVIATPSAFLNDLFKDIPQEIFKGKVVFSAVKGIIPEFHSIPARFIHKTFGTPYDEIGIISGPCHAEEVALERLSYLTIACQDEDIADEVAELFACRYIKTTTSDDLFGTELSAVLKNVYSIASGICSGL